jgi:hypothetical protein
MIMSHSKITKRGRSHYVERWNARAKRFVVTCALCGHTGFSPNVLEDGFANTLEKQAIVEELQSTLEPLALDELGRCGVCVAAAQDKVEGRPKN